MASAAIFQLSCFSSIYRVPSYRLPIRSFPNLQSKIFFSTSIDKRATDRLKLETKIASQNISSSTSSHTDTDAPVSDKEQIEDVQEESNATQQQKSAKIHDFCLGIPYGGLVLTSGLIGFAISRNPAVLRTGVFFGSPLLALSTLSLKVWRKGKSSLPFMLGQAVLAAVLMWKSGRTYSLTKTIFPTGLYVAFSAAMVLFYSYVVLSGGNPPPKKKKLSSATV